MIDERLRLFVVSETIKYGKFIGLLGGNKYNVVNGNKLIQV